MQSLKNRLLNEDFYTNATSTVAHPSTREELINEIKTRLAEKQTDLNDIDTSRITDMSELFSDINLPIDNILNCRSDIIWS